MNLKTFEGNAEKIETVVENLLDVTSESIMVNKSIKGSKNECIVSTVECTLNKQSISVIANNLFQTEIISHLLGKITLKIVFLRKCIVKKNTIVAKFSLN